MLIIFRSCFRHTTTSLNPQEIGKLFGKTTQQHTTDTFIAQHSRRSLSTTVAHTGLPGEVPAHVPLPGVRLPGDAGLYPQGRLPGEPDVTDGTSSSPHPPPGEECDSEPQQQQKTQEAYHSSSGEHAVMVVANLGFVRVGFVWVDTMGNFLNRCLAAEGFWLRSCRCFVCPIRPSTVF